MYNVGGMAGIFLILLVSTSGCSTHSAIAGSPAQQGTAQEPTIAEVPTLPDQYVAAPVSTPKTGSARATTPEVTENSSRILPAAFTTITGNGITGDTGNSTTTGGDTLPVAQFTSDPTMGFAPLAVQFTDTSQNQPASWRWNFDDGSESGWQNPAHTYASGGQYTISFAACNGAGCDSLTAADYISVYAPDFSAVPASGTAPLTVTFNDTGTGCPEPTAWYWDFGDGTTSTARNPIHLYKKPDTYSVKFWIAGQAGTAWVNRSAVVTVT
jgi:PKD repeat protein